MGGGSSEVTPFRRRSVTDALSERLPGAVVTSEVGCRIDRGLPAIDLRLLDGEALRVEYFDQAEPVWRTGGDRGGPLGTRPVDRATATRPGRREVLRPDRRDLHARRVGTVAPRPRERGALGATCRRRRRRGQHRAGAGRGLLRGGQPTGRGGVRPRGRAPVPAVGGGVAPLGLLPHPRRPDRRGAARGGRRARARRGRGEGRRPGRGRGRVERPVGVRGARPARPLPAGPPGANWSRR